MRRVFFIIGAGLWFIFGLQGTGQCFLDDVNNGLKRSDEVLDSLFKQRSLWKDSVKIKVGGEFRYRFEYRDNYNLNRVTNEDDQLNLFRERLNVDLTIGPYVRIFAEGQSALSFADSSINKTNAFVNKIDLRQLYAEVKSPWEKLPLSVKVGRQELAYGDERLIGAFNWSNVARVFDAVKTVFTPTDWFQLDMFFAQPVLVYKGRADSANHNDNLFGIYASTKPLKDQVLDAFLFIRNIKNNDLAGEIPGEHGPVKEYTAGNRFKGKWKNFDYGTEYALQFGRRAHDKIKSWAFHQEVGYTFSKLFWTPRPNFEYNHASGDSNSKNGTFGTFDQLFPTNHDKYGLIDFLGWKNMDDIKVGASVKPHARITVSTDFHFFFLDTSEAPWFNAGGGVVRPANPSASSTLGKELDIYGTYKITEHLSFLTGYSRFFTGPFVNDSAGAHDDANFFYVQTLLKF